jgi:hypothetical protein
VPRGPRGEKRPADVIGAAVMSAHQFIAQRTLGRRVSRLVLVRLALVLAPFLRFAELLRR